MPDSRSDDRGPRPPNGTKAQPRSLLETTATVLLTLCAVAAPHVAVAWFLVAAACDAAPDSPALPDGVTFLGRDSAGVLVATMLGTQARAPNGWVADTP